MSEDKILVVPDLHGNLHHLQWALHAFPHHRYVFLGDLIDRGAHSRQVVQKVRALVETERAELCLGNHEDLAIRGVLEGQTEVFYLWIANGGLSTLRSYGLQRERDFRGTELEDDLQWLQSHAQPFVLQDDVLISHAAPPHLIPSPEGYHLLGNHHIWDRPTRDALFPLADGTNYSVHGHTPFDQPLLLDQSAYYLDLGGYYSDQFVVMELPSRTLHGFHGPVSLQVGSSRALLEDSHA